MKKATQKHLVVELAGMVQLLPEDEWREMSQAERAARKVVASGLPEDEAHKVWLSHTGQPRAIVWPDGRGNPGRIV